MYYLPCFHWHAYCYDPGNEFDELVCGPESELGIKLLSGARLRVECSAVCVKPKTITFFPRYLKSVKYHIFS